MSQDKDKDATKNLATLDLKDRASKGFNLFALSAREEGLYIQRLEEAFLKHDTLTINSLKDSGTPFTHRMLEAAFVHHDRSLTRLCLDGGVTPKESFVMEIIEKTEADSRRLPVLREIVMHGMISHAAVSLLKEKGLGDLLDCARPETPKEDKGAALSEHPLPGNPSLVIKLN